MAFKINKSGRKLNSEKNLPKIYSIRKMLPKKYRRKYDIKIVGDKLHLIRKQK